MSDSIRRYLAALAQALEGSDPAFIQDALADAESRLRLEAARLRWTDPSLGAAEAEDRAVAAFDGPDSAARLFKEREALLCAGVAHVLPPAPGVPRQDAPEPPPPAQGAREPWPGFLEVLTLPRAYAALLYAFLCLPIGLFCFIWVVTGISLSISLVPLFVGIPLGLLILGSIRALGIGQGRLVEALLGERMPRRLPILAEGRGLFGRLGNLLKDGYTWSTLGYFVIHYVLSILSFTLMTSLLAMALSLLAAPILHHSFHEEVIFIWDGCPQPEWLMFLLSLVGAALLVGSLHAALLLGRLHGKLAKILLVKR